MRDIILPFLQEIIPEIDRIEMITVRIPFVQAFSTSSYTWTGKEAILLKMTCGGHIGWGECVADPDPFYSPETTTSAAFIIKEFLLPLLQKNKTLEEMYTQFEHVRGNGMAKATVENALLDLVSRLRNIPLYQLLGFNERKIMSGISIGLQDSVDLLLAQVQEAVDKKYHRIKMKIKRGQDIEWVKAVREHFPDIGLMVDANGDYRPGDAHHLSQLDAYNLMMIEQPLSYHDIYQHSHVQKHLSTPVCLDESIHSLDDAIAAIELGSCRIINIKQGRVGGLREALRISAYCAQQGIDVWSGGMDETGIGRAFNIHMQADPGFNLPGDTSETSRYFLEDIVEPPVMLDEAGFIEIPSGAGIGAQVVAERLDRFTISRETLL